MLPAQPRVRVSVTLPDHAEVAEELRRKVGLPEDAPAGTGWEELYFWSLQRR